MKLLILNCYSRNALAVINGLDKSFELWGGANRKEKFFVTNPDRLFKSPRLKGVIRYSDPAQNGEAWARELIERCREIPFDGIIPTGTTTTNALSQFKPLIEANTSAKCLVEEFDLLRRVNDKWHTFEICQQAGVPTPKTALFRPDPAFLDVARAFRFPVVVKPRASFAAIGVRFFSDLEELARSVSTAARPGSQNEGDCPYVLQERIDGDLHDVTSFACQGQVKALLSQQRVVSLYDWGGGGIVNKTTFEPVALDLAERFLRHVGWSGVLVFDFIRDKTTGEFLILECNPKIWGSTDLTIQAGFNVAQMTVDHFLLGKDWPRVTDYERDLLYKWWVPECLFHWIQKPHSAMAKRIVKTFGHFGARRSINNLRRRNARHLLGVIFDRAQL
jgi:glutathione synthase/RimK-type ligase-like ATP-grasp enzyme